MKPRRWWDLFVRRLIWSSLFIDSWTPTVLSRNLNKKETKNFYKLIIQPFHFMDVKSPWGVYSDFDQHLFALSFLFLSRWNEAEILPLFDTQQPNRKNGVRNRKIGSIILASSGGPHGHIALRGSCKDRPNGGKWGHAKNKERGLHYKKGWHLNHPGLA
jgi:hypothetical protein